MAWQTECFEFINSPLYVDDFICQYLKPPHSVSTCRVLVAHPAWTSCIFMSAAVGLYELFLVFISCDFNVQLYWSLCLLQGKDSAAVLQLTADRQNFHMSHCCLYLAENLIRLPEGRKDWNSTNIMRSFCIYNAQCVKPSQPWPGRSTASSMWWIFSCRWSCRPFPCWHTATPAATGTSWTHRLPPCWWDEVVFAKLISWCVSATFPSRLITQLVHTSLLAQPQWNWLVLLLLNWLAAGNQLKGEIPPRTGPECVSVAW